MQAMKDQSKKGPNFTINRKELGVRIYFRAREMERVMKRYEYINVSSCSIQGQLSSAQLERNKTKEQLEEEKKISLSIRIKPLEIDNLSIEKLRYKANDLWETIVKLETEKYDLEERQKRQDYDVSIFLKWILKIRYIFIQRFDNFLRSLVA